MKASTVPSASALLRQRAMLQGRVAQVANASTLEAMFGLVNGTGLEAQMVDAAREYVRDFLAQSLTAIETQLTGMGVELDA